MDLKDFLTQPSLGRVDTGIGGLWVFWVSMKDQTAIDDMLSVPLEDSEPEDFIKAFTQVLCFPENDLEDGKSKPSEPVLESADIEQLEPVDFENIAELYLKENQHLCREQITKKERNESGESITSIVDGKIEHPRLDSESAVYYLHRLTILERQRQRDRMKKMFASVSGFSEGLTKSIKSSLSAGNSLAELNKQLRSGLDIHEAAIAPKAPNLDWLSVHESQAEARLAPFNLLADRLDTLIEYSIQTSDFNVKAHVTQTEIASEIKASGDAASEHSKTTIGLTKDSIKLTKTDINLSWIVIAITVFGIATTVWIASYGATQAEIQRTSISHSAEGLKSSVDSVSDSFAVENEKTRAVLEQQLELLEAMSRTQLESQQRIDELETQLRTLNRANNLLELEVEQLREKIQDANAGLADKEEK